MAKKISEVFGMSNEILPDSYVNRGSLDEELTNLVSIGKVHIALRGASKCGKSWLRRQILDNPIVVQCRLHKKVIDLYSDALSQLDIQFIHEVTQSREIKGTLRATGECGAKLLSKVGLGIDVSAGKTSGSKYVPVGRDINDLRYVADIIAGSGRQLVIEDYHYLTQEERRCFAFDLKAFWDWGVQVVIVGVWSVDNMMLTLNPDLSGRVKEIAVSWSNDDLGKILDQGGSALNISFQEPLRSFLIESAYGNAGQLQLLVLTLLCDELRLSTGAPSYAVLRDRDKGDNAAMLYAEQLNPLYQTFAQRVAKGIRGRTKSTNIYAHAMAVIMNASDYDLLNGFHVDKIFAEAKQREPRILLGNLKSVLTKIESLQVDKEGRGLVLSYNPIRGVSVVDRQLLLYRKFATVSWPWDEIISSSEHPEESLQADEESEE